MNEQINRVSILGCGWLGLPLAEFLVSQNYSVKGSTTTPEKVEVLRQKNIQPYLINLLNKSTVSELTEFLKTDCLVINFPPRLRAGQEQNYLPQIDILAAALQKTTVSFVIFISSTSVYHDVNRVITEDEEHALIKSSPLYQAENRIQNSSQNKATILRFGGLVGGNRHPGRFLAGKTEVPLPDSPVNLLHLDDCIAICTKLITHPQPNEVFQVAADEHPTRQQFYTAAAEALQLPPPQFTNAQEPKFKVISNQKLKTALLYEFIYPDPMLFF